MSAEHDYRIQTGQPNFRHATGGTETKHHVVDMNAPGGSLTIGAVVETTFPDKPRQLSAERYLDGVFDDPIPVVLHTDVIEDACRTIVTAHQTAARLTSRRASYSSPTPSRGRR